MKIKTNYFYILFSVNLLLSACSSTRTVTFNITQPAEITLPADINTMLLVDRTKFSNEMLNIIEGILTGELPSDDRASAQEAMNSMKNQLGYSPRFNVKILPDRLEGNSIHAAFPQPLGWDVIDGLCVNNGAELVVCLEVFDTDFIVTNGTRIKKKTVGEGANKHEVDYTEYFVQGVGRIKIGIRTYYNKNQTIVDQQMISRNNTWEAAGSTLMEALDLLISKSNANKYLAGKAGEDYAYKISPMPVSISRSFYGKSKHIPEVETGSRYADVNKWDEAINQWKTGLPKADNKEAGHIAYNIAIGYEALGEYGTALTWAQDSYVKYGNKKGRDYAHSLENRIEDESLLKEQMNH